MSQESKNTDLSKEIRISIRTRFRFKIIIRYYSFSLIQFSISFSKNQYLHNWNRVLIAVSCLALTWMYVLMWSEPGSDLSKYNNINLIIQIKSNKPPWYTWFIVGSQIIIFRKEYKSELRSDFNINSCQPFVYCLSFIFYIEIEWICQNPKT